MKTLPMTPEQSDWFAEQCERYEHVNPCVRKYGIGPADEVCKNCRLFIRKTQYSSRYFKCQLRGDTNGPGTDHRANWPACSRFVRYAP